MEDYHVSSESFNEGYESLEEILFNFIFLHKIQSSLVLTKFLVNDKLAVICELFHDITDFVSIFMQCR